MPACNNAQNSYAPENDNGKNGVIDFPPHIEPFGMLLNSFMVKSWNMKKSAAGEPTPAASAQTTCR
jgi:hypothetical protein